MHMLRKNKYEVFQEIPIWLIFTAIITILIYTFCDGINGNDFWWHIKAGEWIVQNKMIPTKDIFSWYGIEQGVPWIAHEWLAEVILYLIHRNWGDFGIFTFAVLNAFMVFVLIWFHTKKFTKQNILLSALYYVFFAVTAGAFFYGRPHVFSYILLFLSLKVLYQYYEEHKSKGIYLLPLIAIVWSNVHGGSSNLIYLLCIIFLVAGICNIRIGCVTGDKFSKKWAVRLFVISCLTVAALAVNPYGINILKYPYENMSDKLMISLISEWQAPDAKNIGQLLLFYMPIGFLTVGFVAHNKKIRLIDLLIFFVFVFLFFRSIRFIMLWYIAAGFSSFRYLPELKVKAVEKKREVIVCVIAFVALIITTITAFERIQKGVEENTLITKIMSVEMLEVVKKENPQRLFNDYNLGECLIYENIPVFLDGRADVYSQCGVLADGAGLLLLQQFNDEAENILDVDAIVRKYNFNAMLVLKNRPLYLYLQSHPQKYEEVYEDSSTSYFRLKDMK